MKPSIEELHHSPDYELIESFHIDEMGQFLARELGMKQPNATSSKPKLNTKTILFFLVLVGIGGLVGWAIGKNLKSGEVDHGFDQLGLAFLSCFVILIPIHELIHALVFKVIGAEKVGFGWSTKSMIVYAYAQKFIMTLRENSWVAAMPFIVITLGLSLLWYLYPEWPFFWGTNLFLHTTACMGDFILIRYFFKNKQSLIYTYDDIEGEKRSYFFRETKLIGRPQ
jgi:hypothetical protein